ncbi:phosphoribulokinase/uridine kinase family protein [Aspergillus puulaauensis]|uniref:Putative kinase n=1 Tax=Aspergillus puulaauensis TaxID=1220207 RepID=A0A7R7XW48_9EURO|nr:putative kinase [Aspergillus puulaauensis]BCS27869.1 putative kinase [Aspergillus puulaauensis]
MESQYTSLASTITQLASSHSKSRYIVAIAGAPGSGKTTLATAVGAQINRARQVTAEKGKSGDSIPKTMVLSMDGFHLPRSALDALPDGEREQAYIRRGAPWTFDVKAFSAFMKRLREWADGGLPPGEKLYAPTFDHATKDPVAGGVAIDSDVGIVIVEGNYILLDEPEWRDIGQLVDYRVFVDVDLQEARERLARRHVEAGIERCLEDGFARVDKNDYLNGVMVKEKLGKVESVVNSLRETM